MLNDLPSTAIVAAGTGLLVASGIAWSATRPPPPILMKGINYDCYSLLVDTENLIRESPIPLLPELKRGKCRNIRTLYDAFQCGLMHGKDSPCLGYKSEVSTDYQWISYAEVDKNSMDTGAGIIHRLRQAPGQNTRIGIFMKNCVEWIYLEQSCSRYSMVSVPLYDTLGEEACTLIINLIKCEVLFVDTQKKVDFLLRSRTQLSDIKYIVCTYNVTDEVVTKGRQCGLDILQFSEILKVGKENPYPLLVCKPDDVSTIFFTSGTTGSPKGCVVTNAALISNIACFIMTTEESTYGKKTEVHLSFLPLSHVFERVIHILLFMFTGKIALFSGDIRNIIDEMKHIKPTILFGVPRLLNRIYDKVTAQINQSKVTKMIFNMGLAAKMKEVQTGVIRKNSIWDYILFRKIQAVLGGKIEIMLVASAPTSGSVLNFFRAVMGAIVLEAYGQTETTGVVAMTLPGDYTTGQVGPPVPGVRIKLCDVPELDFLVARDAKGEICVKGPSCIKEYFNNAEMTAKLIDAEGWLHSGDVGEWTEKGQLKIVDRCKHLFKLSQGEYLAPEKLENVYGLNPLVSQIYVTGDSLKDYCVAVVVPELDGWRELGRSYESVNAICEDSESVGILLKNLEITGKTNKLMGFEIVKKVVLWPQLMTIENGLLTPTLKLKRMELNKFFEKQIQQMYS